jgi:ABC-2 type transport system ATP-binding protein
VYGISTVGIGKTYGSFRAVDSLTFNVKSGDIFGLIGPNGAGKTTTMRMLCGTLSPTTGTAFIAGYDIAKENIRIKKIIGFLPESTGFYNWMSGEEYLYYFARLYDIEEPIARKKVRDLLDKVGLAGRAFAPVAYYSRGMKQRLALARSLINDPKILFLDEPTLGMDPRGQQEIQKMLSDLNLEDGVTIFLSTHALTDVSTFCNRIGILNHGKLIACGSLNDLRNLLNDSTSIFVRILRNQETASRLAHPPFKITIDNVTEDSVDMIISDENIELDEVIDWMRKQNLKFTELRQQKMNLDEIFFRLTKPSNDKDSTLITVNKSRSPQVGQSSSRL